MDSKSSSSAVFCRKLEDNQDMIMIIMWLFSMPLAGCCCLFRACCSRDMVRIWMVIHANVSFWIWIFLIVSTFTVCGEDYNWNHVDVLICMGTFFLMLSILISLLSALATDRLYPDCRLTQRGLIRFIDYLRSKDPEMVMTLPVRQRSFNGKWEKARKTYEASEWFDYSSNFDTNFILGENQDWIYKLEFSIAPEDTHAKCDLDNFIWAFGQQFSLDIVPDFDINTDYKICANIEPPPGHKHSTSRSLAHHYGRGISQKFPPISTDKCIRIYTSKDGTIPFVTDLMLRFAWFLNLIGFSSVVLATLTHWKGRTRTICIHKKFRAREGYLPLENEGGFIPASPPPPAYNEVVAAKADEDHPPSYDSII